MKHPNLPKRTIRHAAIMKKAGFVIDKDWMGLNGKDVAKSTRVNPNSNVAKLIYWRHPLLKMTICIHDYEQITLKDLVRRIYHQACYWTKKEARVAWDN